MWRVLSSKGRIATFRPSTIMGRTGANNMGYHQDGQGVADHSSP
jgi:hypothetical protein